jgi:outer membrane receptor protein involved in Fe transport
VDPSKYGVTVTRDNTGAIDTINAPNLNLQDEEISGIDLNAEVQLMSNLWQHELALENDFSYILYDKLEGFPGAGKRDTIGEWEKPHWRNVATLSLKNDITTYRLSMRSIPGQNVEDRTIDRKVSDMTEYDVSAAYKWTPKIEVAGGIKNILNSREPMDVGGGTGGANVVSNNLYDINGRKFFVSYNQKF